MDDPYDWDSRVDAWEEVAASNAFLALRDRVVAAARPQASDRVADLGAGTGLLALAIAPHVERVSAVDISRRMLDRLEEAAAADGIDNITSVVADLRTLPLADESVTLAVSNYAFHHLADADKAIALSEVRRILTPGGRLVVCDMMFALSLHERDRRLLWHKVATIARRGPAGLLRIARNAGRVAARRWEHPSPPEAWTEMLAARHFVDLDVALLAEEAGLATASRPLLSGRGDGYVRAATDAGRGSSRARQPAPRQAPQQRR